MSGDDRQRLANQVGRDLDALCSTEWPPEDQATLQLITICWNHWNDPAGGQRKLAETLAGRQDRADRLTFLLGAHDKHLWGGVDDPGRNTQLSGHRVIQMRTQNREPFLQLGT